MLLRSGVPPIVIVVLAAYATLSVLAFVAFWRDKRAAQAGGRRIRERTLLVLTFAGGWPGALLARALFRHKTRDWPFVLYFFLFIGLHVALAGGALWVWLG